MEKFIGRKAEMEFLNGLWSRSGVVTCSIYGRRQVGKSRLIDEFSKDKRTLKFQFNRSSPYENLVRFRLYLSRFLERDVPAFDSLTEVMVAISDICREEKTLVVFDEFPYLAEDFPQVPSILQGFIDVDLNGTDTMVIICGSSIASMREMTENMDGALYGRFPTRLKVEPLPYHDCMEFHTGMDPVDGLKLYMTLGGVPKYHISASKRTYEGCIRSCFLDPVNGIREEGSNIIVNELRPGSAYTSVVSCIADGRVKQTEIAEKLNIDRSDCKRRLDVLEAISIVARRNFVLKPNSKPSYHIMDPMVDFHYRVIRRNEALLEGLADDQAKMRGMSQDISTFLDIRFESVCMEWMVKNLCLRSIGTWQGRVDGEDVDIDIVAESVDDEGRIGYLLAECKFRNKPAGFDVLNSLIRRADAAKVRDNRSFYIFSIGGFRDDLREYAEEHGISLIGPEELIDGL